MAEETGSVVEWRIENFSHWSAEVHGGCIKSPVFYYPCSFMQLYPKGIIGQGEHLVVCFCGVICSYSGELSFYSSDGDLLCFKQQVNNEGSKYVLQLPPGPKFEDVLSRIRESENFITVRFRVKNRFLHDRLYNRMSTTINVLKISLEIHPKWIEEMKSDETKHVRDIYFQPDNFNYRMGLNTCSKNNMVYFLINPLTNFEYPIAVYMCMRLTRINGLYLTKEQSYVKKEHIFRDNSPWTFSGPMHKQELYGKEISLFLCLKTRYVIQRSLYCENGYYSCVSIEFKNTPCSSEKAKVSVLTKDSGSQTSFTTDMPDNSVLSKELMCLYQDQKYSDITLKCENVTFPVHRAILSARSPVLDRMLSSDMKETASGKVDIGDIDPSTLSRFLTYLYTGTVEKELQCDRALKLYYAADKYQVPSLKKDCSKFLCANVSLSNVCDILSLAVKHRDDELTASSHDFILDNYNAVLGSQEWATLRRNEPLLAVDTVTQFAVEGRVRKHHS